MNTIWLHVHYLAGVLQAGLSIIPFCVRPEAPQGSEFLSLLRISEFFGFQWQNLTEILRLLPKVLQSENEAVIMITSPLYNICLQQM